LLLRAGAYDRILSRTENLSAAEGSTRAAFLYYRSLALAETGEPERARAALELAVQTIDPESASGLERYLLRGGNWDLLQELYAAMLQNDPEDSFIRFKVLASCYYQGDQSGMLPVLDELEPGEFADEPDMEGFLSYAHLVLRGYSTELHRHLEGMMNRYPEVFDFRLITGVSHVLRGDVATGRAMAAGMPELGLGAPRYLRMAAVILGSPVEELLGPAERQELLPRERYLISLTGR
jgi:tetratricopeptide (TPR) repeat protein